MKKKEYNLKVNRHTHKRAAAGKRKSASENNASMDTKKSVAVIVIAVVVLAVAAFFAFRRPPAPAPVIKITDVAREKLPAYFPSIPVDSGARVVGNYNAASPDGSVQSTRAIESPASVLSNFIFYKNYLTDKSNGWKFLSEVNSASSPGHKALFAKNSAGILNIIISSSPKGSVVDISFLALKPAK